MKKVMMQYSNYGNNKPEHRVAMNFQGSDVFLIMNGGY